MDVSKPKKKSVSPGVCYLGRIPPRMDHKVVRHMLSPYGELDKIYLVPRNPSSAQTKNRDRPGKHQTQSYSEGWVEFKDKRVAKRVAGMLNGEKIGGKKRSAFYYDLWNIKYLSKFKWDDLTGEIAYKNAEREQKLALEISAAKKEQEFYLSKVDMSRKLNAIDERMKKNQSCVSPSYMAQQQDINEKMRAILIDWFIEVYDKFEVMDETLFLTINLIDRFLERQVVVRKNLQLVGVTAMLLACKYEEVSVPIMEDFVLISDKAYTRQDVLDMEKSMVKKLQFNFSVPTPYVFMRRLLKAAQSDKKVLSFLIALCLVEYEMLKYPLSLLAAAAIYTAQCSLSKFKQWHTNYLEDFLL